MRLLLSLSLCLFYFQFLAQKNISQHLAIPPQHLELGLKNSQLIADQVPEIIEFIQNLQWESFQNQHLIKTKFEAFVVLVLRDQLLKKIDEYSLSLHENQLILRFQNLSSFHYLKKTSVQLLQYLQQESDTIPDFLVKDWANFERRGYMLDISRDKVPNFESTLDFVDLLSEWRINELQLYTEHTFAYKNHQRVWENYSPFTAEQIRKLDSYCRAKGIDLVPNQNSFGHLATWLKHDQYKELAECEDNCKTKWGNSKRTSLAPTNPNSLKLMEELYSELLPNFTSPYFNIGGDETLELCLGKSKAACDSLGKGKVYLDYIKKLNAAAKAQHKDCQFWGDIILNHPELIAEIPKNMTPLVWGYDAIYPFDKNLPKFKAAGLDFYVCPGTSTWRSEIGKNQNAFINLKKAAVEGKKNGAKGYLITDWGDYGHFQPRSISYASIILGASYAWNYQDYSLNNLEETLNKYVFLDKSGNSAKALLCLGNAYQKANIPEGNANAFHLMIRRYKWTLKGNYQTRELNKKGLMAAEEEIDRGLQILSKAMPECKDASLILEEVKQASALAKFGIHLGLARLEVEDKKTKNIPPSKRKALAQELKILIENHKRIWLLRNRPGGLQDSSQKLQDLYLYLL